ncbi:MAG: hypothetical protein ABR521_09360 [Gaiellaceae bacterium]
MIARFLGLAVTALLSVGGAAGAPTADGFRLVFTSERDNWQLFVAPVDGSPPRQLTRGLDNKRQPAWSPDGRTIAYVSDRDGEPHVYLLELADGSERRPTRGQGKESSPSWSPDGRELTLARQGSIFVAGIRGGGERRLTKDAEDKAPSWSPRGDRIAFLRGCAPHVIAPDGSGVRPVDVVPPCAGRFSWSPGGVDFVATLTYPIYGGGGLYVGSVDTSALRRLPSVGYGPAWSPDGATIAHTVNGCEHCSPSSVSLMNADGTNQRPLTSPRTQFDPEESWLVGDGEPAWAPDGRAVVFARNTAGTSQVYSSAPDGAEVRRLTDTFFTESRPAVSPDGRWLAFLRVGAAQVLTLFVKRGPSGGLRPLRLPLGIFPSGSAEWAPDSRRLAIGSDQGLWVIDAKTGRRRRVVNRFAVDPSWSPDGRRLAFATPSGERGVAVQDGTIWIVNADGRNLRRVSRSGCDEGAPDWSPDGRELAFQRMSAIYAMRTDGRGVRLVLPSSDRLYPYPPHCFSPRRPPAGFPVGNFADPEWSPDGSRIAVRASDDSEESGTRFVVVAGRDGRGLRQVAEGTSPTWTR